jgi:hypothetical protein
MTYSGKSKTRESTTRWAERVSDLLITTPTV